MAPRRQAVLFCQWNGEGATRRGRFTAEVAEGAEDPFVIDHRTIVIVHFRLLAIGDYLYFIGYLGARWKSVNG